MELIIHNGPLSAVFLQLLEDFDNVLMLKKVTYSKIMRFSNTNEFGWLPATCEYGDLGHRHSSLDSHDQSI